MSTAHVTGFHTGYVAGEALEPYRRVKLNTSSQLVYADKGDKAVGVTDERAASGDPCRIKLANAPGTFQIECSEAISNGANVYATDDGKIGATGGVRVGKALIATSATGDECEVEAFAQTDLKMGAYTATAQNNTDNYADVDTGLGVALVAVVYCLLTSAGVNREAAGASTLTIGTGGAGTFRVANANMAAGDLIYYAATTATI